MADLEKEFEKQQKQQESKNPLGNSITKEILQQSKKMISNDGFDLNDDEDDYFEDKKATGPKKNLEIEIDDNADYDQ